MNRREAIAEHFGGENPKFTVRRLAGGGYDIRSNCDQKIILSPRADRDLDVILPGIDAVFSGKEICDALARTEAN